MSTSALLHWSSALCCHATQAAAQPQSAQSLACDAATIHCWGFFAGHVISADCFGCLLECDIICIKRLAWCHWLARISINIMPSLLQAACIWLFGPPCILDLAVTRRAQWRATCWECCAGLWGYRHSTWLWPWQNHCLDGKHACQLMPAGKCEDQCISMSMLDGMCWLLMLSVCAVYQCTYQTCREQHGMCGIHVPMHCCIQSDQPVQLSCDVLYVQHWSLASSLPFALCYVCCSLWDYQTIITLHQAKTPTVFACCRED